MRTLMIAALGCALPGAASAQDVRPVSLAAPAPVDALLPPHTEVVMRLDEEVASNRVRVGQIVPVSVARDVVVDGLVMIPRGTAGFGEVTARTGKGAFGKSGKIDLELRAIRVAGRDVPIVGRYHESGKGRAGETIGTILVGGIVAGAFVTGRHAVFEVGRELTAFTADTTRIAAPARRPFVELAAARPPVVVAASPATGRTAAPVALASLAPAYRAPAFAPAQPQPVRYLAIDPVGAPTDSRYDTLVRFERGLAAAQPVRAGDARQGWKISD